MHERIKEWLICDPDYLKVYEAKQKEDLLTLLKETPNEKASHEYLKELCDEHVFTRRDYTLAKKAIQIDGSKVHPAIVDILLAKAKLIATEVDGEQLLYMPDAYNGDEIGMIYTIVSVPNFKLRYHHSKERDAAKAVIGLYLHTPNRPLHHLAQKTLKEAKSIEHLCVE